nr:zinc finger, CCHC-type [Tanacetum cinerariifolium]
MCWKFSAIVGIRSYLKNWFGETKDEVSDQHSCCFNVEDDPKIADKAIKSQDIAFWKEAINDEIDSIMGNNTWVLADLPLGCKPIGYKWIFKRKLKVDGTIEKLLVIQGFKQNSRIYYFDTYALAAHISAIRLLITIASIHNLIIHQMDVKTSFLNGDLNKEWRERFLNYLEEQMDGEAMINSIQNGDHPLPVVSQVSLAETAPNAIPTLKDPKFWTAEEKKTQKINRLARSLLIQGIPNNIYSLIDSNKTAKDL